MVEDRSDGGDWTKSSAQHVTPERFPVRIFSQGQIAELAGDNQRALLDLIDDGAGTADRTDSLITAQQGFNETRARLRELDRQLSRRGEVDVALEDTDRKLEAFEGAGHAAALQSHREAERQRRELDRHFDVTDAALGRVDETAGELGTEDIPADLFDGDAEDDQTAVAIIEQLGSIVATAAEALRQAAERGRQQVERLRTELSSSAWRVAVDRIREAYDQAVATLDDQGIGDPAQHAEFVQERQRLTEEFDRLVALRTEREDLAKQQEAQLRVVTQARRTVSEARIDFLARALAQNEFVRIRLVAYGDDLRAAERSLREAINVEDDRFSADIGGSSETASGDGIINRLLDGLPLALDGRQSEIERRLITLHQQFIGACRGEEVFGGHFNNYLQRACDKSPEFLDRLLTWFPPDSLQVEHSRSGNGTDFVPIGQGSAGQRSAAMLAFLLAHGDEPLVLDQPEDDLDNQLIYSLVVRQMRENKLRRQIIAVTHNPNIVVNGDAEMLHVLDFVAGQCRVVPSGSLQGTQMRDEVCRVMEGGRDTRSSAAIGVWRLGRAMFDSRKELLDAIRLGETSFLELKEVRFSGTKIAGPARDDLADGIAAFANSRGGVVVLGVDDKSRDLVGIPRDRLDSVVDFVKEVCNDKVNPPLEQYALDRLSLPTGTGQTVDVVKVEMPRSLFVHRSPGGYLHRVADSKRAMSSEFLARLFQQHSQARLIRFDEQVVGAASLDDLAPSLWQRFQTPRSEPIREIFLTKLGMASSADDGVLRPTVTGVLMGSDEPQRWLRNAYVQAVAYRGSSVQAGSRTDAYQLDAADIYGPLDRQIIDACRFVARNMNRAAMKTVGRVDSPQYDRAAVFEAVVNAVAHRDYAVHGSKIRLRLFVDRLELYSPGALANSLTIDSLRYRQTARNETLCSLLTRCPAPDEEWLTVGRSHFMEKRGEGVPIILDNSVALSGREPEFSVLDESELRLSIHAADPDSPLSASTEL